MRACSCSRSTEVSQGRPSRSAFAHALVRPKSVLSGRCPRTEPRTARTAALSSAGRRAGVAPSVAAVVAPRGSGRVDGSVLNDTVQSRMLGAETTLEIDSPDPPERVAKVVRNAERG